MAGAQQTGDLGASLTLHDFPSQLGEWEAHDQDRTWEGMRQEGRDQSRQPTGAPSYGKTTGVCTQPTCWLWSSVSPCLLRVITLGTHDTLSKAFMPGASGWFSRLSIYLQFRS